jgi:tetratricopeptide (TPR) repeat protein
MMTRKLRLTARVLFCFASLLLFGCSKGTSYGPSSANPNGKVATVPPKPNAKPPATMKPQGDPIDTSKLDADIAQAETNMKEKSGDDGARVALAHAYLARASALTKARQYRSALGDYRRTLKYDPQNKDAVEMSGTIISILKNMGRDVPAEGEEPPPLPFDSNKTTEAEKQSTY